MVQPEIVRQYVVGGLTEGQSYQFKVRAKNFHTDFGEWSAVESAIPTLNGIYDSFYCRHPPSALTVVCCFG